ncbi:ribokinase [Sediminibacillus albus]|uniref:Ribokinase n=1 Tax=Sediminibacillus albus TaxID=407036 RepID=A0A1G9B6A8_9BACI|nr:ribokinase [Sediminibacillus albus]SDK35086.1 ribokinase [Sediminibacillus albus]
MNKIAVIGSLNMDIVVSAERAPKTGETIHGQKVQYVTGGKGANQAVAVKKLGGNVQLYGMVGKDVFGQSILHQLSEFGISTESIGISQTETGVANIVHLPDDNSIIVIPGANGELDSGWLTAYESEIADADVLLMQLEIPVKTVDFAMNLAVRHGVKTILNPAPARQLPEHLLRLADFVTPNQTELETLLGIQITDNHSLAEAMQIWEKQYRNRLIVTLGEQGAAWLEHGELVIVPAARVPNVLDTTGAGDCFNAGLAYGISKDWHLAELIQFAVTAASLSVTKFGAQAGMPSCEEVFALLK